MNTVIENVSVIDNAQKFQDLLDIRENNTPYFFEKIFAAKSWSEKIIAKRKFKLLKKIHNQIESMLYEDEKICFLTSGVQQSFVESIFLGNLAYYINRRAFICTTHRIIIIQISVGNKPMSLLAQIDYAAIDKIESKLTGKCKIKFKNGKTSIFSNMPKSDRIAIKEVIDFLRGTFNAEAPENAGFENLCPNCFIKIEGYPAKCHTCNKEFKSVAKAAWLSFIFPGLGDLYLGSHTVFAVIEMLVMIFIWVGYFAPEKGEEPRGLLEYFIGALIIIGLLHTFAGLGTRLIARKGIYPVK
ncbi:MAG: hypothetical protein A2Y10_20150 [Planctomycetes bacterium GWF2_41_51]|nr:MAG: hypothetical protein A2Y10_20150 [Planctomycetes bacterium GWF2_41_51]HBG27011.1 hypothetical protein [Phycisphaerales bacterium]